MKFVPTIPNFLTIFRVVLIPLIIYFLMMNSLICIFFALVLFGISALTDTFDGILARKLNQLSEFGEYFDPLADKFLIWSLFVYFSLNYELMIPFWLVIFIVLRDIAVTVLRSYSKKMKIKFRTSYVAKAKTAVQMIVALLIMVYILATFLVKSWNGFSLISYIQIWQKAFPSYYQGIIYLPLILTICTVIFTMYTGFDYFIAYKKNKAQ
jgi:CDP-diacylglycerol--glycerol-3-phosphate 3-phosphatidyltransferase